LSKTFTGGKAISNNFNFAGHSYTQNATSKTSIEALVGTIEYERTILSTRSKDWGFQLGFGGGVKYMTLSLTVKEIGINPPHSEKEQIVAPMPVANVRCRLDLTRWITLETSANGIIFNNVRNTDITILDARGEIQFNIITNVYIAAGYHIIDIDGDSKRGHERVNLDSRLDGLYFSVGLKF
jgi:hypothetical protein